MTLDRLNRQIARADAHLAPCDDLPLHAAQTAFARRDRDYFPRWVAHEVAQGRPPSTNDMILAGGIP